MSKKSKPLRKHKAAEVIDTELETKLALMLEKHQNITFRAVAKQISGLSAVSSITRDEYRRSLVEQYVELQDERKKWIKRINKTSREDFATLLAKKDEQIVELERRVNALTASHKAMILAMGELGGMKAWRRFFDDFENTSKKLLEVHLEQGSS